jgi:CHAT domain
MTLTTRQIELIVRRSILEVAGPIGKITAAQSLDKFGFDTAAKLKRLKAEIANQAARLGHRIGLSDLNFDHSTTIGAIFKLILLTQTKKPAAVAKKKPAPKKSASKKAAPKKAAKKASLRGGFVTGRNPQRGDPAWIMGPGNGGGRTSHGGGVPVSPRRPLKGDDVLRSFYPIEVTESVAKRSSPTAAPPLPKPARMVKATPQLEIRKEQIPGQSYQMAVFLDQAPAAPGAEVKNVKVTIPSDLREFCLDVWLDCSSHFSIDKIAGPSRLTVEADTGTSDELGFTLQVIETSGNSPMYVSAFFRYGDRPCGRITRFLDFVKGSLRWKQFVPPAQSKGDVVLPKAEAPPSVTVDTQSRPADIRVEVLKTESNDGRQFTLKCFTPQGKWEGAWSLPEVTRDFVNTHMQRFMSSKEDARVASLRGAGLAFWDALPTDAKRRIWTALENGAASMSVVSQEPYIPWELMVPYQKLPKPRQPLGIELRLGRWITGDYTSAVQHIPMKSGYIICPRTSGLASAAEELAFLTEKLRPAFAPADEIVPATFTGVDKGLAGPPRNVIHFICHGKSAVLQTLELEKPDTLNCSEVRAMKGFLTAFAAGPLVFLNACEVGGQVLALDGVGGFANSFIELGAAAVVAPLWPVQDKIALEVTRTFYTQALKGVPFAEVMQTIRRKAYDEAIDSYAAYCFYGDPLASVAPK